LIGDPSGRSTERPLLDTTELDRNVQGLRECIEQFKHVEPPQGVDISEIEVINNADFYKDYKVLDFLRNVGKHFRVSIMLSRVRL